ncbi:MAG: hypothetical protein R3F59_08520 [Myxococcota bacterium]
MGGDRDGDGRGDLDIDGVADTLEAWGRLQSGLGVDDIDYRSIAEEGADTLRSTRDEIVTRGLADDEAFGLLLSRTRSLFDHPDVMDGAPLSKASFGALSDSLALVMGVSAFGSGTAAEQTGTVLAGLNIAGRLGGAAASRERTLLGVSPRVGGRLAGGLSVAGGVLDFGTSLQGLLDDPTYADAFGVAMGGSTTAQAIVELLGKDPLLASKFANASVALAAGLSVTEATVLLAQGEVDKAIVAALPAIGAGIGAVLGCGAGASVGLVLGTLAQALAAPLVADDTPAERYEQATQIAWEAALSTYGIDGELRETLAHELRNVDDDWVGAGPVLALIARDQHLTAQQLFDGLATLAARGDGRNTLKYVVAHNLLDADITNWDAVVDAAEAAYTDPSVVVPALTYDEAQLEALGDWLVAAFETSGDALYVYPGLAGEPARPADTYNEAMQWLREHPDEPLPVELEEALGLASAPSFVDSPVSDHVWDRTEGGRDVPVLALPEEQVALEIPSLPPPSPGPEVVPFEAVPSHQLDDWALQAEALGYARGSDDFDRYVEALWLASMYGLV